MFRREFVFCMKILAIVVEVLIMWSVCWIDKCYMSTLNV